MLKWKYIIVIETKGKQNVQTFLLYTHDRYTYQQGSKLLQT